MLSKEKMIKYINDFAPFDDSMTVFLKKAPGHKSDGFAVIINGEIYVIDSGTDDDTGIIEYLLALREKWLENCPDGYENAKLCIHLIISHTHNDHVNAQFALIKNKHFDVISAVAPTRAYLSTDVPGANEYMVKSENKLDQMERLLCEYGHSTKAVMHIPFAQKQIINIKNSDAIIEIFPSPFDWSVTYPSEDMGFKHILKDNAGRQNFDFSNHNAVLNANSLWTKFTYKGRVVLFTGDQRDTKEVLNRMIDFYGKEQFECDVLKYIHHGEQRYNPYLVEATRPKIIVFSGGALEDLINPKAKEQCINAGDLYILGDGSLTLTITEDSIIPSGISPRK